MAKYFLSGIRQRLNYTRSSKNNFLQLSYNVSSFCHVRYFCSFIAFRVSRRRRKMYNCGHARLCVCLSAAACLHYCTDPDVTLGSGRGCPLVVHYWADLHSVHGLRCYGNTRNAWQSPAVIRQAHRTHYACRRRLPSPAIKSTRLLRARRYLSATRPFHFVILRGCCNANAKC